MLIIKINLKILRATLGNCKEVIISNAIKKNYEKRIGDGNHSLLIKWQQVPPKIMQKLHLGHHPFKMFHARYGSNKG